MQGNIFFKLPKLFEGIRQMDLERSLTQANLMQGNIPLRLSKLLKVFGQIYFGEKPPYE
jgi:hypothetical protein